MAQQQRFKVSFFYSDKGKLRTKERVIEAFTYEDAVWKIRREYLAKGLAIKIFRMPQKV